MALEPFPPVTYADKDGLLAAGGDLSTERLLLAYKSGIFPWFSEVQPILWWSPDPRFILFPQELVVSKSMQKVIGRNEFEITMNTEFAHVIDYCARVKRKGQRGTWITEDMKRAYIDLHQLGHALSVEARQNGKLVGGLYGVKVLGPNGAVFCGESMFSLLPNASKAAFITLVKLQEFAVVDCQVYTEHLESLGARMISRDDYLKYLPSK
jgi:leucyl/phenylalanyl-tRNA--protein transferase